MLALIVQVENSKVENREQIKELKCTSGNYKSILCSRNQLN